MSLQFSYIDSLLPIEENNYNISKNNINIKTLDTKSCKISSKLNTGIPTFGVHKDTNCDSHYCLNTKTTNKKPICWDPSWKYNSKGGCEVPSVVCPTISNEDISLNKWELYSDGYYNIIDNSKAVNIPHDLIGNKSENIINSDSNRVSRNSYDKPNKLICNNCCKNITFSKNTKCKSLNCENTTNNIYCTNYCSNKNYRDTIICPKNINEIVNLGGIVNILKKILSRVEKDLKKKCDVNIYNKIKKYKNKLVNTIKELESDKPLISREFYSKFSNYILTLKEILPYVPEYHLDKVKYFYSKVMTKKEIERDVLDYLTYIKKDKVYPSKCITMTELSRRNKCSDILSKEKIIRDNSKKYKKDYIGYQRWLKNNKDHDCNVSEFSADKICQIKECYDWAKRSKINLF